ncbi:hypothetical protein J1614_008254 [Plenodomus biglobosus]|nr:hypothetical protein J1614_008254 [Plenodomus biglobosus]
MHRHATIIHWPPNQTLVVAHQRQLADRAERRQKQLSSSGHTVLQRRSMPHLVQPSDESFVRQKWSILVHSPWARASRISPPSPLLDYPASN